MNKKKRNFYMVPLAFTLTIIPLIVRLYAYDSPLSQFNWYPKSETKQDFFLYYKAAAIILAAAVMCVLLAYRYMKKKREFKWCYELIPVLAYAVLTILSSLFSEYRYFSFHGMDEIFESLWVLLGYCVILFYAYELINTIEDAEAAMRWLTAGLAVMLVIGVMQALGHDPFRMNAIKKLMVSPDLWGELDSISIIFEPGRVFLTLYNPNYVASYFALMIPVEMALLMKSRKWVSRILYLIMLAASLLCLLASGNRSGMVAFAATIVLAVAVLFKQMIKSWKVVIPVAAVAAAIFAVYLSRNDMLIQKFIYWFNLGDAVEFPITKIETGDEDVAITYMHQEFHVAYDISENSNSSMSIYDADNKAINNTFDSENILYVIQDERFPDFSVQLVRIEGEEDIAICIKADYRDWYFKKGEDGTYYYYNIFGRWDKINNAPRVAQNFLTKGFEARGDIWSKTIPLLKNCILFGYGADTFTAAYPQDDYVNKVYTGAQTSIDAKPHCFYLQVAVQSGIPALLALLALYAWYLAASFRLYTKASYQNGLEILGVGLMLAAFAYLVSSIANDSTVAVSPIHWALLGIGIAVNEILKKENEAQEPKASSSGKA